MDDWKIVDWDVKPQHNQPTKPRDGPLLIMAYHLPNATVPANEPVCNHRVMYKMLQNVACIYKLGINNC